MLYACLQWHPVEILHRIRQKLQIALLVTTSVIAKTVSLNEPEVQAIYANYIALKDDLVTANEQGARDAAKELSAKLNAYKGCENTALIADKITNEQKI